MTSPQFCRWSANYDTPISKSGTKLSFGYSGNVSNNDVDNIRYYKLNSGVLGSLEYQIPISKDFKHNIFMFYDCGYVEGDPNVTFNDHIIHSLGLGFKSNWSKHIYSTLTAGFPLKRNLNEDHVSGVRLNYLVSGTF